MFDVLIIGSGVMGMSVARNLKHHKLNIGIIDRDIDGMHASYKAGGMLGAQNEFSKDSPTYRLALESQQYFKQLSDQLLSEVGSDIEYKETGLIKLAYEPKDNNKVIAQHNFLSHVNPDVRLLEQQEAHRLTGNNLNIEEIMALYIPNDHQINANKYTKALYQSLEVNNVERIQHTEVLAIKKDKGIYKVITNKGDYYAPKVVVAGGAWSHKLVQAQLNERQLTGVKGEVILMEQEGLGLQSTIFMTNGCYLVPKNKNRVLIGATSYFDDYSVGVSQCGVDWLIKSATQHIPKLKYARKIKEWSGVRPHIANEIPIMDEVDEGLFVITGHYRNGILLSPIVGELMSKWILTNIKPQILNDFTVKGCVLNGSHD
ncbi:NAD(P)/FAD-dependent oxidoreductase [Staphylococcus kloosii]|jgi:glycine oxidase|uniref:NAD(P)/FAD-dependent oxidoreductase n=1 Tax=Staphylococcus kloosii TaxID=29384 RepID=UPI00189F65EB|nr:FAD-dependent oxidoreductase [Staphylococcus kloosii]MBF7025037.1 FAD-dependent oxidoreductase [Staphylococcus kloosii]